QLDDKFATVHRNLGWAYHRTENNIKQAVVHYEKAISCDSTDPRLYAELDVLYELEGTSPKKRLALLEKNHNTVIQRDDSLLREIMLLVQLGRYDDAIKFLTDHHFHTWEGGGEVHDVYVDAYLLRGAKKFKNKKFSEALEDYHAAGEYPENLEVGRPRNDSHAPQVNYFVATAYEALGNDQKAQEFYEKSANQQRTSRWPQTRYYQALAFSKLGKQQKAAEIFDQLIADGQQKLTEDVSMDFFAKFGEQQTQQSRLADAHYVIGLGYLGQGKTKRAKERFQQALELNINHLWAAAQLSELK
ncbi:MAG: tetratricopeptide repeat protein, partial [Planctomycetota bacterium]